MRIFGVVAPALIAALLAQSACSNESPQAGGGPGTTPYATVAASGAASTSVDHAGEPGWTISRDGALAANKCLDLWAEAQSLGQMGDTIAFATLDDLTTACDNAFAQVQLDLMGAPVGSPSPIRTLAIVVTVIGYTVFSEMATLDGCYQRGQICGIPAETRPTFLQVTEAAAPQFFPTQLTGYIGILGPTVEVFGLTLR